MLLSNTAPKRRAGQCVAHQAPSTGDEAERAEQFPIEGLLGLLCISHYLGVDRLDLRDGRTKRIRSLRTPTSSIGGRSTNAQKGPEGPLARCHPSLTVFQDTSRDHIINDLSSVAPWVWMSALP